MQVDKIKAYVEKELLGTVSLVNKEDRVRLIVTLSVPGFTGYRRDVFNVYRGRQDNYQFEIRMEGISLRQSFHTEGDVISKLNSLVNERDVVQPSSITDIEMVEIIAFLGGHCEKVGASESDEFKSLRYKVQFPNGSTCQVKGWVNSINENITRSSFKVAINGAEISFENAVEYLRQLSGVEDNSTINVASKDIPETLRKIAKVVKEANRCGYSKGSSLTVGMNNEKETTATLSIPVSSWCESYIIFVHHKPEERYGILASKCSYKVYKTFNTEDEIVGEIFRLLNSKPNIEENQGAVSEMNEVFSSIRLAGGSYRIQSKEKKGNHKFLCTFANNKQATFSYGQGGKLKINELYPMCMSEALHCMISLSDSKTIKAESTQNGRKTSSVDIVNEAIVGRKEHMTEINRLCVKYGIRGKYQGRIGIPKYRWDGRKYVRVKARKGTILKGCIDVDCYRLVYPNGNQYYLYVDTEDSYYALAYPSNPNHMLAVSTSQTGITEAITREIRR